ncbi:hypothetical protein AWENTII_012090 [Aspergillus wentii]
MADSRGFFIHYLFISAFTDQTAKKAFPRVEISPHRSTPTSTTPGFENSSPDPCTRPPRLRPIFSSGACHFLYFFYVRLWGYIRGYSVARGDWALGLGAKLSFGFFLAGRVPIA